MQYMYIVWNKFAHLRSDLKKKIQKIYLMLEIHVLRCFGVFFLSGLGSSVRGSLTTSTCNYPI